MIEYNNIDNKTISNNMISDDIVSCNMILNCFLSYDIVSYKISFQI